MADAPAAAAPDPEQVRMSFGEHLEELRSRLFKALLALGAAFAAAVVWYRELLIFVIRPHYEAMRLLGIPEGQSHLIQGGYTQPIWAVMKLAFIVAVVAASPVIAWQIWKFVSAGLYPKERRHVTAYAPLSFALFLSGCVFGYLVLIPYGLYAMAQMLQVDVVDPTFTLSDYLNLVMTLTIVTGFIFELPLMMMFLTAVGLATPGTWWRWIRFAIVGIFVASAILTPSPDIFTQVLMAAPLTVLYLLGILASALVGKKGGALPPIVALIFVLAAGTGGGYAWWRYRQPAAPEPLAALSAWGERWYVVRNDGKPEGWARLRTRKDPDGWTLEDETRTGPQIERNTVRLGRDGALREMEVETGTRTELRRWRARVEQDRLVFDDGRAPLAWSASTHTIWSLARVLPRVGGEVTLFLGQPEAGRSVRELGAEGELRRFEVKAGDLVVADFWTDRAGVLVRLRIGTSELSAAPEAEARAALAR